MPVISAFRRLMQEDQEFEASLGYTARPYLQKETKMPFKCKHPTRILAELSRRGEQGL